MRLSGRVQESDYEVCVLGYWQAVVCVTAMVIEDFVAIRKLDRGAYYVIGEINCEKFLSSSSSVLQRPLASWH